MEAVAHVEILVQAEEERIRGSRSRGHARYFKSNANTCILGVMLGIMRKKIYH